ncbi:MAG: hypothetical protein ACP5QK_13085 [Myxococcota bacterium]
MKRFFLLLIVFVIGIGCSDITGSDSTLNQEMIDRYTGYAIIDAVSQLYNINFAGRPVGSHNITTTCPQGGDVTITGNVGYAQNNDITTVDLTFNMTNCKSSKHTENGVDTIFTLTGIITFKGSFNSSTNYNATTHQSDSLKITGTIKVPNYKIAEVDESCNFSASITNSTVSGSVCSRTFSY